MKKISTIVSSTSLIVYVSLSYFTFFAVIYGWLQTDPDILWTREQYVYTMAYVVPLLVAVCYLSTLWFHFEYNKNHSKKIFQGMKKLVEILFIISTLATIGFAIKHFPISPNNFILVNDHGNGELSIHHAFSYESLNNSIQCENNTYCAENLLVNSLYYNITREEKVIFVLGNLPQERSSGLQIFDAESKEFQEKLKDATCLDCKSNSSVRCKEIDHRKCPETCVNYPSHDDILTIRVISANAYRPKEELTSPYKPFFKGDRLEVEVQCINENPDKKQLPMCENNPNQICRRSRIVCKGSEIWDAVWESTCQNCESDEHCERMGFHERVCRAKSCFLRTEGKQSIFT